MTAATYVSVSTEEQAGEDRFGMCAQLPSTIAGLDWELQQAMQSDIYVLREKALKARDEGRNLLREMADGLQAEIRGKTKTLN